MSVWGGGREGGGGQGYLHVSCAGIFRAPSLLGVLLRLREACTGADSGVPDGETRENMIVIVGSLVGTHRYLRVGSPGGLLAVSYLHLHTTLCLHDWVNTRQLST